MRDGSIKVMPPVLPEGMVEGEIHNPPLNGTSLPYVSAVDLDNEEVRRVSNMLGIFV